MIDVVENKLAPIKELVKNPENFLDVVDDVPVLGTAISFGQAAIAAYQGDEKAIFKEAVQAGLAFYGFGKYATVTDILIDVGWEVKDKKYQEAASEILNDFIDDTTATVFTKAAWAMTKGKWKDAINAALEASGFENAGKFSAITWSAIEDDYESAIKEGLSFVGYNPSQTDSLMKAAIAYRDSDYNKLVLALTGKNAQTLVSQKAWVKNLTDGNTANDLQAIQDGLKEAGFTKAKELSSVFSAVKNKNLVDAASTILSSTGTNSSDLDAFLEGISLIDGADELKDGFQDLFKGNVDDFIQSIVASQPLIEKIVAKFAK